METHAIEIFVPAGTVDDMAQVIERFSAVPSLAHLWVWNTCPCEEELPSTTTVLAVDSLTATSVFKDMAARASCEFVLYVAKPNVEIDVEALGELCDAMPENASMAYANYRKAIDGKVVDAPTIDCLEGALRNDFDFGPVLLIRTSALKKYLAMELEEHDFAGFYQLRLALERIGRIYHFSGYFCGDIIK